jgi:hypothetical protein
MFPDSLDLAFKKAFKTLTTKVKYLTPLDICPGQGPQAIQDLEIIREFGFCQSWAALYVIDRLSNPKKTQKSVLKKYLNISAKQLDDIIRFTGSLKKAVPEVPSEIDYDPEYFIYVMYP